MKKQVFLITIAILAALGWQFKDDLSAQLRQLTRQIPTAEEVASSTSKVISKVVSSTKKAAINVVTTPKQLVTPATTPSKQVNLPPPLRALPPSAPPATLTRYGVITYTNLERKKAGLPALKENSQLNVAATVKVKDMFVKQYFEHVSPTGVNVEDLAREQGYEFIEIGENLALGNFTSDAALVTAWMNSPGHRANILHSSYTEIGVAVLQGTFEGHRTWMAVQHFGRPLASCPSPSKSLQAEIKTDKATLAAMEAELERRRTYLEQTQNKNTTEYRQQVDEYNKLVAEHNALVEKLKKLIAEYNAQVAAFNSCLNG